MSQQLINLGSIANDGTGSPLRTGGQDINANFTELYAVAGSAVNAVTAGISNGGAVDSTVLINSTLATLAGQGSGALFFPEGIYLISLQANNVGILVPGSNLTLAFAPGAIVRLITTSNAGSMLFAGDLTNTTQYGNIRILGGKFDCNGSTDTKGVDLGWVNDVECRANEVYGTGAVVASAAGIRCVGKSTTQRSTNVRIVDPYIHDMLGTATAEEGVIFEYTSRCKVRGGQMENTGRGVFFFGPNDHNEVQGVTVYRSRDNGIRISSANGGDGTVDNVGHRVNGCTVIGSAIDGIRIDTTYSVINHNLIQGWVTSGTPDYTKTQRGIKGDLTLFTEITDNNVSYCGDEGIYLAVPLTTEYNHPHQGNTIGDNGCFLNGGSGIRIAGGGTDTTQVAIDNSVIGNKCTGNGIGGFEFEDNDRLLVTGNTAVGNTIASLSAADKQGFFFDWTQPNTINDAFVLRHNRAYDLRSTGGGLSFLQTLGVTVHCTNASATVNGGAITDNNFNDTPTNPVEINTSNIAGTLGTVRVERNKVKATSGANIVCRSSDTGQGNYGVVGLKDVSGDRGDASVTLTATAAEPVQQFLTTLTANRTVTLTQTSSALVGHRFRIVRNAVTPGNFTLTVQDSNSNVLKAIAVNTNGAVECVWNGNNWKLDDYTTF